MNFQYNRSKLYVNFQKETIHFLRINIISFNENFYKNTIFDNQHLTNAALRVITKNK